MEVEVDLPPSTIGVEVTVNLPPAAPEPTGPSPGLSPPPRGKPPIVDLKVNQADGPLDLEAGATITLSWSAKEVESVTASGGWGGTKAASGKEKLGPLAAGIYVFTLTAANEFGTAADSVTVKVKSADGEQKPLQVEVLVPQSPSQHQVGPVEFKLQLSGGLGPFKHKTLFPDAQFFELESPDREVTTNHTFAFPISPGETDGYGIVSWSVTDLGTAAEVVTQILIEVVP
jgi:hypothetical protein